MIQLSSGNNRCYPNKVIGGYVTKKIYLRLDSGKLEWTPCIFELIFNSEFVVILGGLCFNFSFENTTRFVTVGTGYQEWLSGAMNSLGSGQ